MHFVFQKMCTSVGCFGLKCRIVVWRGRSFVQHSSITQGDVQHFIWERPSSTPASADADQDAVRLKWVKLASLFLSRFLPSGGQQVEDAACCLFSWPNRHLFRCWCLEKMVTQVWFHGAFTWRGNFCRQQTQTCKPQGVDIVAKSLRSFPETFVDVVILASFVTFFIKMS